MSHARRRLLHTLVATVALAIAPAVASAQNRPAAPAPAEQQFTILIFESPTELARRSGSAQDAYWSSYDDFAAALMRGGVLRGGSALSESVAVTVRGTGSADAGVRGARLSGYFVIAADDIAAARRWASQAPSGAIAVEVRPHRANPHMMSAPPR